MVRASSPKPVLDGHDEVSSLRQQLRCQQQTHRELQTMLKNQALAIETFQSKWQVADQEAHAFIARTRAQSEDFARTELTTVQRFEDSLQRQYDGQLRSHVNALQDECREHVGQEDDKMSSSMPSLKGPAFVTTNCNKPYDNKCVRRNMQSRPER